MALNKDAIKDRLEVKEFPASGRVTEQVDRDVVEVLQNKKLYMKPTSFIVNNAMSRDVDRMFGDRIKNREVLEKNKIKYTIPYDGDLEYFLNRYKIKSLVEKIVKKSDGYYVTSEDGKKNLGGPYDTEEEAKKRLQQVHYFKNKDKKVNEDFYSEHYKDLKSTPISDVKKGDLVYVTNGMYDVCIGEFIKNNGLVTINGGGPGKSFKEYEFEVKVIIPLDAHIRPGTITNGFTGSHLSVYTGELPEDKYYREFICLNSSNKPIKVFTDEQEASDFVLRNNSVINVCINTFDGDELVNQDVFHRDYFKNKAKKVNEGAEGKREPGYEYVIFEVTEKDIAPIVAIRSTRVETAYLVSKLNSESGFQKDYNYEKVPKGKFHKGDDFWGPFDKDYNKLESLNENINFNTIFDSAGFEQEVLNKIPFSVAGIKSVSSKDLRKIKDYIASNFESIKERILELESDGVSKREMISILEDDILELGIRNNITTLAYIIYNGVKYIDKRFENESLTEGIEVGDKYIDTAKGRRCKVVDIKDVNREKHNSLGSFKDTDVVIEYDNDKSRTYTFKKGEFIVRFRKESLNEDVKVTGDEDFTVKDVDVEHTGGNIWVAFGVYDNGLGFSLGSDLLFIYDEDARKEWDAEDQYEWENEHIVWDDYSEGLTENSNLFKSTLRQVFKKELNKHPTASPREVADDADIFWQNEDIIKDLLNGERPGKARATLEALDELNIDKFIKIDDKELRDKANKLFNAGVITRNQLIFNITEDDINKLYKQWFKDNGKLRNHRKIKNLKESVEGLDELLKLNLKPMELFAKAHNDLGISIGEDGFTELLKYANDYFKKNPVSLGNTSDIEFLDNYDEDDDVDYNNHEEIYPSELNSAYGTIEDIGSDIYIHKTTIPNVVFIMSDIIGDGFTTMDSLNNYFNDENNFNYNIQEMAKEYEQDGMFDTLDESLNEDLWDEDGFFSREELDEFTAELQDIAPSDVAVYKAFIDSNNVLEVDWSYQDFEETSSMKIDMRKIKTPSDLIKRYLPSFKFLIDSRVNAIEMGIDESLDNKKSINESSLVKDNIELDDGILEWGWEKPNSYYVEKNYWVDKDNSLARVDFKRYYSSPEAARRAFNRYKKQFGE